jgi:hypothetical protein
MACCLIGIELPCLRVDASSEMRGVVDKKTARIAEAPGGFTLTDGFYSPLHCKGSGDRDYIHGLEAFVGLLHGELNLLFLVQGFKTIHHDSCVMYKDIVTALAGNESITLGVVEPFNGSFFFLCHF